MSTFGLKIKEFRKRNGMSQQSLAKVLRVSRSAVSMWEMGEREPDIDTVVQIAQRLGMSFAELVDVEWADPADRVFVERFVNNPDDRVAMHDRYVSLCEIVKHRGYCLEQKKDGNFVLDTPDGGVYTISEDDMEDVMKAVEKAAMLQLELIAQREHQRTLENVLLKREDS